MRGSFGAEVRRGLWCILAVPVLASTWAWAAAVPVPVKTVETLHPAEPYPSMVFHDGGLWLGTARGDEGIAYRLRRYDSEGRFHSEVTLPHTVGSLRPIGPNRVMVVGKSYRDEWRTHYSDVSLRGGALRPSSYRFSRSYQVEEFAGDAKRWFFTEPGDRAILTMGSFGPSKLPLEVSGPGVMSLAGNNLYVLERNAFSLGDENLVRFDLTTKKATRVFGDRVRNGLVSMLGLPGGGRLVLAEGLAGQIVFVDAGTGRAGATVSIPAGLPRGLALRGHCVVVGTDDPSRKVVTFVDYARPEPVVVAEWELTETPKRMKSLFGIAVDPASKRVFARSHEACLGCAETSNFVVVAEPPTDDPAAACDR